MLRLSPAVRAACAALLLAASCRSSQNGIIPPAGAQRAAENAALSTGRRTAVVDAASRVAPAVVSITVASHRRVAERGPWDFFFFMQLCDVPSRANSTRSFWTSPGN